MHASNLNSIDVIVIKEPVCHDISKSSKVNDISAVVYGIIEAQCTPDPELMRQQLLNMDSILVQILTGSLKLAMLPVKLPQCREN